MKPAIKTFVFVSLLGAFYACGGFALPPGSFDSPLYLKHSPIIPWALIILCYAYGAIVAIWGNKTIGIFHPISFRSRYVVFGALLMGLALLFTSCERAAEGRRPDKSPQPAQGQTPSAALTTSNFTVYQIKMTTTFVVPEGNDEIDQVLVYHALPTVRPWSQSGATYGARNLGFTPDTAKEEDDVETGSRHLLWTINGRQKPGTKLTFNSMMTVTSADRNFDSKAARVSWKDYANLPADKTAVVDPDIARAIHPELAKVAARLKKDNSPPDAVLAMCKWIEDNIKYDASVTFDATDVDSIVRNKCGHCGHQATVLEQLTASVGIPFRTVWGMNLYASDGRTSDLQEVRADYTNIHTWGEVYFPGIGWVEVDPGSGAEAYRLPAEQIQNNRGFQNYSIWMRESGLEKEPTWTPVKGGFRSDYGVEHIIKYGKRKAL